VSLRRCEGPRDGASRAPKPSDRIPCSNHDSVGRTLLGPPGWALSGPP
jgi:hypothetical protein